MKLYITDESLSQAAKEEQYRHVEEDISSVHTVKPVVLEPGGAGPPVQHYPLPQQSPAPIGPQPQLPASTENTTQPNTYPSFESFVSAQQITQEHLKRDKHLWTLLTSKYNAKAVVEDSGVSTGPGSGISTDTSMKYTLHGNGLYKIPLDPVPTLHNSSSQTSMDTGSDRNDNSVYKFKHNITKRFSEETTPKTLNPSDSSSISSREDQKRCEKLKRKFRHVRSRSPSSTISSQYPNSDSSNNNSSSNGESSNSEESKPSCYLPGFVLHPVGTHYIPLSIHPSNVGYDFFAKATQQGPRVFHPISIPVNFGGPLLYMKSVGTDLKNGDSAVQMLSSEGSSSRCPSGCPSENSPNPEPEPAKASA